MHLYAMFDMGTPKTIKVPHSQSVELGLHLILFSLNTFIHADHLPGTLIQQFNSNCLSPSNSCSF